MMRCVQFLKENRAHIIRQFNCVLFCLISFMVKSLIASHAQSLAAICVIVSAQLLSYLIGFSLMATFSGHMFCHYQNLVSRSVLSSQENV